MNRLIRRHRAQLTALVLAAASSAASAQIGNLDGPYFGTFFNSGQGSFVNSNVDSTALGAANSLSLKLKGDWSYAMPRSNGSADIESYGLIKFSVGPLPVRVSDFKFSYHAKWANGGGNAALPDTTITLNGAIKEQLGAVSNPATDPTIVGLGTLDSLRGNGLKILHDGATATTSQPILAVGRTYYLFLQDLTKIQIAGFTPFTPSVTVTNEYGGTLSTPTFAGLAAEFNATVVPAPGTLAVAGAAGLAILRRRRQVRQISRNTPS